MNKLTVDEVVAHFNRPIVVNEIGCWLWLGSVDQRGYGRRSGSLVYGITFRMAGFICDNGKELCHTCPNRNCVNPYHLYAGTHKENMKDASDAGVMGPKPRYTKEQLEIAVQMLNDGKPKNEIAKFLGVSPQWISKFLKGGFKHAKLS